MREFQLPKEAKDDGTATARSKLINEALESKLPGEGAQKREPRILPASFSNPFELLGDNSVLNQLLKQRKDSPAPVPLPGEEDLPINQKNPQSMDRPRFEGGRISKDTGNAISHDDPNKDFNRVGPDLGADGVPLPPPAPATFDETVDKPPKQRKN